MSDVSKLSYTNLLATLTTAQTLRAGFLHSKYDWANILKGKLKALFKGMSVNDITYPEWFQAVSKTSFLRLKS